MTPNTMRKDTIAAAFCMLTFLAACATSTPVEQANSSKSGFDGAVFSGETVTLDSPTPGEPSYRVFQQGATGFVSLSSVRSSVEEAATAHCDRKGKSMHGLVETAAKPPFILGNFPRVELQFECIPKAGAVATTAVRTAGKYERLAALKKLLDDGTLTQQEFESEKAKVLSER